MSILNWIGEPALTLIWVAKPWMLVVAGAVDVPVALRASREAGSRTRWRCRCRPPGPAAADATTAARRPARGRSASDEPCGVRGRRPETRSGSIEHFGFPLPSAALRQDGGGGLPQDEHVEGEGPVLDVAEVEPDGVVPLEVRAAADLPETGEPGGHQRPAAGLGRHLSQLMREMWAGSDERHGAVQHVEELGKLVQREVPQELARAG